MNILTISFHLEMTTVLLEDLPTKRKERFSQGMHEIVLTFRLKVL